MELNIPCSIILSSIPIRQTVFFGYSMSPRINCKLTEIDLGTLPQEGYGWLDERFAELVDLEKLNLASSAASGDISMLSYNTKLKYVELSRTKVSGHISTILCWKNITLLDLSDTEVYGQPNSTWQACCKNLHDLNLARSKVNFLPPVLENGETYTWMPTLTNLDLTGSPTNGDVSDLLKSFEHCTSLGSVQAVACGLTGELNGRNTTSALVALNLRWNNLLHVESVPPRCKSLILAGMFCVLFSQTVISCRFCILCMHRKLQSFSLRMWSSRQCHGQCLTRRADSPASRHDFDTFFFCELGLFR